MSVPHPRAELLALIEGRLDPARRAQVERHLAGCANCRAEAAELAHLGDTLGALPAALRGLSEARPAAWSAVWSRVQGVPMRRMVPQLNLYLSLAAVVFVLAAALPAGLAEQPLPVTAGVIQTPVAAQFTPAAGHGAGSAAAAQASTALAAHLPSSARPIPNPTPVPGLKG